ncbi:MAG: hypothetical protein ACE5JS_03365 [Nitrospinota bacterium]
MSADRVVQPEIAIGARSAIAARPVLQVAVPQRIEKDYHLGRFAYKQPARSC